MDQPAGLSAQYGSAFQERSVAEAYQHRPPYPPAVFDVLASLVPAAGPRRVLDAGCGTGGIARYLPERDFDVDAVDISAVMVEHGRQLPGGDQPRLRWLVGPIEEVPLAAPYGLVTTGESLHWMEWDVVMPRFAGALAPDGVLVVLELQREPVPWREELIPIIRRYSTNQDFASMDLTAELARRGRFVETGRTLTPPWTLRQPLADYVESFHGRASFSRERMDPAEAAAFDEEVARLVRQHTPGDVELPIVVSMVWGRPA